MADASVVTRDDIAEGLRALGVQEDDLLLVHSSLSSFGRVEGGADAVIDGLLDAIGPEGTLCLPTHTWDRIMEGNPVFDVRETACCVGAIPETFRKRPGVLRGLHPTHSCAAIGPLTEPLLAAHETQATCCGSKSPYQRVMDWGGLIVFLGVDLEVNTAMHALEEMAVVPWVFDRFEMLYTIDYEGRKIEVPSRRHAGGLPRVFMKFERVLEEAGALVKGEIGDALVRVVDAAEMARLLLPILARDPFAPLRDDAAERERRRHTEWVEAKARDAS